MLQHEDILLALFVLRHPNSRAYVTRPYVVNIVTGTEIDHSACTEAIANEVAPDLHARTPTPAGLEGVWTRKIYPLPAGPLDGGPLTLGGFRPFTDPLPPQVAGLIHLHSADPNLCRDGRVFWPNIPHGHVGADSRLTSAGLNNLLAIGLLLTTGVFATDGSNEAELYPVNYSRKTHAWTFANGRSVPRTLSTQTRRSVTRTLTPAPFGDGPPSVT